MNTVKGIIGDYEHFVASVNDELEQLGINHNQLVQLDHLAYRVASHEQYEAMKQKLASIAILLGESMIAKRPIATFELHSPLRAGGWVIPYIELPAPKDSSPYSEGLEHAEFVVVGSLDKFQANYPTLPWITKALTKKINPELAIKTNTVSIKFHEQSLGSVVNLEKRLGQ